MSTTEHVGHGVDDLFADDVDVERVQHEAPEAREESPTAESSAGDGSDREELASKAALEYLEDEDSVPPPTVQEQTAWINLPQLPLRRTKETMLARLPNFVRYCDRAFDAATWDEDEEDALLGGENKLGDKDARSILRTMSTVRWRWRQSDNGPTPESNARIVRWSDGTESLQIGSEFLDMSRQAEPNAQGVPLSYLFVPHPKEGVLEAECAVRTFLSFKPSVHSATHQKIASAIRHHRGARVVATAETFGALDPEREKERIERALKDSEKKRHRERMKQLRASNDYDMDLDLNVRRHGSRHRISRTSMTEWLDDDEDAPATAHDYVDEADDDGFIVHDEDEDEEASDDDMDRLERSIEAQERKRRDEQDESTSKRARSNDEDEGVY
ncbi:Paf1 complex component [Malassezia equina]|uniref:Paf1 complex component n=1 Tax=Malassezia equina TaxID=1381935 RepID=A0AAF0EG51_9BASI|nr:Paf1 complex component [Malassezia equina]